jgi:hypothetical protein
MFAIRTSLWIVLPGCPVKVAADWQKGKLPVLALLSAGVLIPMIPTGRVSGWRRS